MSAEILLAPSDVPCAARGHHLAVLWLAVVVIGLSMLLTTVDDRRVAVTGLPQFPLPEMCSSRVLLQLDCPGCGLTRSFIHFFHGRWEQSLRLHRLGWLLATLTVLQIPYRLCAMNSPTGRPLGKVFPWSLGIGLVVLLAVNWLLKLAGV